jgi:hypothetical protein
MDLMTRALIGQWTEREVIEARKKEIEADPAYLSKGPQHQGLVDEMRILNERLYGSAPANNEDGSPRILLDDGQR